MKNKMALTPPMGWNSWDCYGASVTEDEVRGNAECMARHLKSYGWEYIVTDIQWYEPEARSSAYNPFAPLEMDGYSRLIPAVNRFPSAAGGKGFKPLADYVHGLGLKYGIHILRGIPRQAVHANAPILGTAARARDIAHPYYICKWNTDMYGVNPSSEGAQQYYDSIFRLYAEWGVDFVKVDDISYTNIGEVSYFKEEIEMIRRALDNCGRDMVLSLSPGPAPLEMAEHLKRHANMWRMTGDFWDRWEDLYDEFEKCSGWSAHSGPGHWPDADMLPLGHIALRSCEHGVGDRWTRFSRDEQVTMMTLWCIFRSPLMVGCELRDSDDWTLSLLTNPEVLRVLNHSHSARQLYRRGPSIAWLSGDEDGSFYLALFNTGNIAVETEVGPKEIGLPGRFMLRDLWAPQDMGMVGGPVPVKVASHGARLFKLTFC